MSNKIARRVAIALIVGGLAGTATVLYMINGSREVKMSEGASGKIVTTYEGKQITLGIPQMPLKTTEDKEKLQAIILEQLKQSPEFAEANKLRFEQWKKQTKDLAIANIDESEKGYLKDLAKLDIGEGEKQSVANKLHEQMQACKDRAIEIVDKTEMPPIQ